MFFYFEILEHVFLGRHCFQACAQRWDIPFTISKFGEKASFRDTRFYLKGPVKGLACCADSKRAVQNKKRLPNRSENTLQRKRPGQGLIRGCGEFSQRRQHSRIFSVELPSLVMRDDPDRADRFPGYVKGNEERFGYRRFDLSELREVAIEMRHQLDGVRI